MKGEVLDDVEMNLNCNMKDLRNCNLTFIDKIRLLILGPDKINFLNWQINSNKWQIIWLTFVIVLGFYLSEENNYFVGV